MQIFYFPDSYAICIGRGISWYERGSIHFRFFFRDSVDSAWIRVRIRPCLEAVHYIYIYVHISCVSSSINLNLYFHHLFFCRVVNHEEASQIRSKLRCQINRRLRVSDISGSALFETIPLPWNEEGLSYTFTRRIKTKKSEEYFTSLSIWNLDKPRLFLTRYIYTYM